MSHVRFDDAARRMSPLTVEPQPMKPALSMAWCPTGNDLEDIFQPSCIPVRFTVSPGPFPMRSCATTFARCPDLWTRPGAVNLFSAEAHTAIAALREHLARNGDCASARELVPVRVTRSLDGTLTIEWQRRVNGLRVHGETFTSTHRANGELVFTKYSLSKVPADLDTHLAITREQAVEAARAKVPRGLGDGDDTISAEPVIFRLRSGEYRAGYLIERDIGSGRHIYVRTFVDGRTGEALYTEFPLDLEN
jgi:hypothetical protein